MQNDFPKIRFVFVSKNENFAINRNQTAAISERNPNLIFDYVQNNTQPLATVYNLFLNEKTEESFDYFVFMHADVKTDIEALAKRINECSEKYDVMGLCGCSKFSVSQSPLNWWNGSHPYPACRWGCVTHGELGDHTSFFSSHSPDVADHEVACIDGLCIIISKKAADTGLRFDETLDSFNFYDTDISLQTVIKYKMKLGVIVIKDLYHFSVGRSISTSAFAEAEKKFRAKWNF